MWRTPPARDESCVTLGILPMGPAPHPQEWLRGSDGLDLRLAAPERASEIQRERLSMLGVMLAFLASREQPR